MLCPEVCNFKAPEFTFITRKYGPHENDYLNVIDNFLYSHLVSLVLPDTFKVPESLTQALTNDCDYYKITNVKLSEFVAKDFIKSFVNSGSSYVLSVGTRIDCDNCTAVTSSGELVLNLTKSTYETLGLEGSVSYFHAITGDRYTVRVDLKAKHFKPGKPNYERTKACLETLSQDFIVTWKPPNDDVCPSSIAKYFHDLKYQVQLCESKYKTHMMYSVKVPTVENENHYDFVEWLGMIALQGNLIDGTPDNYVTTYEAPEPNQEVGQVRFLQWRGFFTSQQIVKFYKTINEFKESQGCEWAAMYVQGFSDSPVAWRGGEHHFYTNGDNSYTFILTKDGVISCLQKCSRKRYNNKRKGKPL